MLMYQHKAPHRNWRPGPKYLSKYDDVTLPEPDTLFDDYKGRTLAAYQQDMTIAETMNRGDLKLDARVILLPNKENFGIAAYNPKNDALKKANLSGKDLVRWKYQRYVKDYLRCIASVDDGVGQCLATSKKPDWIKIPLSSIAPDQGFYLGEHGWFDKRWMCRRILRTPLLIRWPGVIKARDPEMETLSPIDFAFTFCEIAGIDAPADLVDPILPILKGQTPKDWAPKAFIITTMNILVTTGYADTLVWQMVATN